MKRTHMTERRVRMHGLRVVHTDFYDSAKFLTTKVINTFLTI